MVGSATHLNLVTWKAKIPLKIKIFLWYLWKGVILTKDNLAKRHWKECTLVVAFVVNMKLFNIFFFIVRWLG
jgi:hypothetical protein